MLPPEFRDAARLGDGAEGGTFVATDRATGRRVVLKRVEPARRVAVRHAFAVLRRVASPHLPSPRALAPDEHDGLWLVCDHVEGRPLPCARTTLAAALAEATAVAHALAAIHDAGTHHGDVSTANVVVTATGGVVLVDLGHLGKLGAGTPGFLAPEVLAGGGGPAADRFALGCLLASRLFGEVPWQRPEAVLSVKGARDVLARLRALSGDAPLDPPLERTLVALLDPDPQRRWADTPALVRHLLCLRDAAIDPGSDRPAASPWWPVARLSYRGVDPMPIVARLAAPRAPRLVALAGPAGSGRGRLALEIVQALQLRDTSARLCDPAALGAAVGDAALGWYEAWTQPGAEGPAVLATSEAPTFAASEAPSDAEVDAVQRAALLQAGAALATRTLVLQVQPAVADALRDKPGVAVIDVQPWDRAAIEAVLAGAVTERVPAWAQALLRVTGGWPGRVAAAIRACARTGLALPEPSAIEQVLHAEPHGPHFDADVARRILVARWRGDRAALDGIPGDLHDGERPLGSAVAGARRRLGDAVVELARLVADEMPEPRSLELALDAEDVDAIAVALLRDGGPDAGTRGRLVAWLAEGGAARLPVAATRVIVRALLADGEATRALALVELSPSDPALDLEAARALQRLGRTEAARARLAAVRTSVGSADDLAWAARGLGFRLDVDAGRAADAAAEAQAVLPPGDAEGGAGLATAYLWGAMAQLSVGALHKCREWLDRADVLAEAAGADDVRARVQQLQGNLALAHGELHRARTHFSAAAVAFARAGESVGAVVVRGSLAALSIPTWATRTGIEHGRAAVRGLLAHGQRAAVLEATLNLVQLLVRIDAREEIGRLCRAVADLVGSDPHVAPEAAARLHRLAAERAVVRARADRGRGGGSWRPAEVAFARAAGALAACGRGREATEARLRAAVWARRDGRLADARAHLRDAAALRSDDPDSNHGRTLEGVAQALARADGPEAVEAAAAALSQLPPVAHLRSRGRLDLAWARDRLLLCALRRCEPAGSAARRAAATRLTNTLETIMSKTAPVDRPAVRAALDMETGEPGAFEELLEELGEEASSGVPVRTRPRGRAVEATRKDELLRIYRRLAREDDLPRLLEQVVDAVMELTDAERGAVVVLPTDHTDRIEVTRELQHGAAGVGFSRSVIERVLESGDPVLSVDAAADDRFDQSRSISHLNLRSVLAVPLSFRGERVGAAYVDHRLRRGNFDEGDLAHMEEFAELAALAVGHARALAASRAQAEALRVKGRDMAALLDAREVEAAALRAKVRSGAVGPASHGTMIGHTAGMQRVFRLIERLSGTDVPVVIYGESGTGKELVARAIHDGASHRRGPFVAENCGAIPETLLESVLFGHARGAFTGAHAAKPGLFEAADGGTIFLDEVGEMSPGMQAKLLRVLQEGEVRRVGENRERKVDVRVIAASNRDLDGLMAEGRFRSDLFYRINVVKLELPPLRERIEDLPALVDHFVARHAQAGRPITVKPAALRALSRHRWPGNVRELENEVQRWVALSDGTVDIADLSPTMGPAEADEMDPDDLRIRPRVDRVERELIVRALAHTDGNQTRAAELLGLSRYGLQKKLRRMGIGESG